MVRKSRDRDWKKFGTATESPTSTAYVASTTCRSELTTALKDLDEEIVYYETKLEKLKRYVRIASPHVGLITLLIGYTFAGACVFCMLEAPYEKIIREKTVATLTSHREFMLDNLWNLSRAFQASNLTNRTGTFYPNAQYFGANQSSALNFSTNDTNGSSVTEVPLTMESWIQYGESLSLSKDIWLLGEFRRSHITLRDLHNDTQSRVWTIHGAIFFASTVISTIGYGHIVPITYTGRIFCIGFGLIGIPLLLITIADIGKFLSDFITFSYRMFKRCRSNISKRAKSRQKAKLKSSNKDGRDDATTITAASVGSTGKEEVHIPVWVTLLFLATYTALGGYLFYYLEGWDFFESFYFCFISMATIGFGDIVPREEMYMLVTMVYIVIGLAVTTMCIDLAGTEYIRKIHSVGQKIEGGELVKQMQGIAILRARGLLPENMTLDEALAAAANDPYGLGYGDDGLANILYEPVSPEVARLVKPGIKLRPDEIDEDDVWVLENKMFGRRTFRPRGRLQEKIHTTLEPLDFGDDISGASDLDSGRFEGGNQQGDGGDSHESELRKKGGHKKFLAKNGMQNDKRIKLNHRSSSAGRIPESMMNHRTATPLPEFVLPFLLPESDV